MCIKRHPREWGITIKCDGGADDEFCPESIYTGNILAKSNRLWATKVGWGRGLRKGRKRLDLCPKHMEIERELFAKEEAEAMERLKQRDEAQKARFKPRPPKEPRRKRAGKSSPSADSGPVPSTPSSPAENSLGGSPA